VVTDRLEQDNDFCNACHLTETLPLHIDVRRDFDAAPPASLAGAHGGATVAEQGDRAFRCIDCHGGTSFAGRARVKVLAGVDAFWWATGHFEEPEGMAWPLWDEDCRKCHAGFDETPGEAWQSPRFHELPVHNVELGVDCVECHLVHEPEGQPEHHFLNADWVRTQCARCHTEFEEDFR
jgi:nitrate/TMAO reductase-like tetraheme cytochrome c subunit